jgi:hypothetical protein
MALPILWNVVSIHLGSSGRLTVIVPDAPIDVMIIECIFNLLNTGSDCPTVCPRHERPARRARAHGRPARKDNPMAGDTAFRSTDAPPPTLQVSDEHRPLASASRGRLIATLLMRTLFSEVVPFQLTVRPSAAAAGFDQMLGLR